MTYYYLYEIKINNPKSSLNNSYYYGKHVTTNLDDNYFGSGKILKAYQNKYGNDGLFKTILSFYNSEQELDQAEYELIKSKRELLKEKCLNLNDGGHGSFTYINQTLSEEQRHINAVAGGEANRKRLEDPAVLEQWKEQVRNIHKSMSKEDKEKRYSKVSDSLKEYYQTKEGQLEKEQRNIKNKESNKKTSALWRAQFQELFGAQPESFRKYGKQKEAHAIFKAIKNLPTEIQKEKVQEFLQSIEDIV